MSKVAIQGNASGTGTFTIAAPNSNTDRTLTLPDEAGTVLTSASDIPASSVTGLTQGITVADLWRLTTNHTSDTTPVVTWEQASTETYNGQVGTSMSHSSGVFTFPATGMYAITVQADMQSESASTLTLETMISPNGGTNYYARAAAIVRNTAGGDSRATSYSQMILDVTSTTDIKVRFDFDMAITGSVLYGNSDINVTSVMFVRLGDT